MKSKYLLLVLLLWLFTFNNILAYDIADVVSNVKWKVQTKINSSISDKTWNLKKSVDNTLNNLSSFVNLKNKSDNIVNNLKQEIKNKLNLSWSQYLEDNDKKIWNNHLWRINFVYQLDEKYINESDENKKYLYKYISDWIKKRGNIVWPYTFEWLTKINQISINNNNKSETYLIAWISSSCLDSSAIESINKNIAWKIWYLQYDSIVNAYHVWMINDNKLNNIGWMMIVWWMSNFSLTDNMLYFDVYNKILNTAISTKKWVFWKCDNVINKTTSKYVWNSKIESFNKSKDILEKQIYKDWWKTIYCWCTFKWDVVDQKSCWYKAQSIWMEKRSKTIEWEHVVPAENFWQSFKSWRDWDKSCVDAKWWLFNGRNCAQKVSKEFRLMESDLYNLWPSEWETNWRRSNYDMWLITSSNIPQFWKCEFKIDTKQRIAEPVWVTKWIVARTYMYMDTVYPWVNILWSNNSSKRKLYEIWDKNYPVTKDECNRAELIKSIQGNINPILSERCSK